MTIAYLRGHSELNRYVESADHTDVKIVDTRASLRQFIASMLSYYPWWIVWLYRVRELLVKLLGLVKHEKPEVLPSLGPEDVSLTPGDNVSFFTVRYAKEEMVWVSETPEDKHLKAYFCVVGEPLKGGANRFYVVTSVYYKHWSGLVYFNLIRPFHHIVVAGMIRYASRQSG